MQHAWGANEENYCHNQLIRAGSPRPRTTFQMKIANAKASAIFIGSIRRSRRRFLFLSIQIQTILYNKYRIRQHT
jgi:hypothetical protein